MIYVSYKGAYDAKGGKIGGKGGGGRDKAGPTINFINPKDAEDVTGIVEIEVDVKDASGVAKVEIWPSGYTYQIADNVGSSYFLAWDTTKLCDMYHRIMVRAHDTNGNISYSFIDVQGANYVVDPAIDRSLQCPDEDTLPPNLLRLCPTYGPNCIDTVRDGDGVGISFEATDNMGISYMAVYVDGQLCKESGIGGFANSEYSTYNYLIPGCYYEVPREPGRNIHTIRGVVTDRFNNTSEFTSTFVAK